MALEYIVYMHISPNGKKYVGQTSQKANGRWRQGEGYKRNEYFYRAIKKYGWENFDHKILFEHLSEEEANKEEKRLIQELELTNPQKGYNIREGGNNGGLSLETRRKIGEAQKGEKNHMYGRRGCNNPLYGRIRTDEEKEKNKFAHKSKPVVCVETGKVYYSKREAERQTGIANTNIFSCCKGKAKTAGGYHWAYAE